MMPRILHIETSTKTCSIGITEGEEVVASFEETSEGYKHSEVLHVQLDNLLKSAKMKVSDLDAVCVSKGPGSYTGLRIGVSSAKGLAYGGDLDLLSCTSLESLATVARNRFPNYSHYIPMIDARRMEVFTQVFNMKGEAENDIEALVLTETSYEQFLNTGTCLFFGDGSGKFKELMSHPNASFEAVSPSFTGMIRSALQQLEDEKTEDLAYFEPFYLKEFVAGKKAT